MKRFVDIVFKLSCFWDELVTSFGPYYWRELNSRSSLFTSAIETSSERSKNISSNNIYKAINRPLEATGLHFVDYSIYLKHLAAIIVQGNCSINSRTLATSWFFFSPRKKVAYFFICVIEQPIHALHLGCVANCRSMYHGRYRSIDLR